MKKIRDFASDPCAPGIMKNAEREMLPGSCAMHMLFIDN